MITCRSGWIHMIGPKQDLWVPRMCHKPYCSLCWIQRVYRTRESIRAQLLLNNWGTTWMLTRSNRNQPSLPDAWEALKTTRKSLAKRASKDPTHSWHEVTDWVGVVEIKQGDGWNVHDHVLITSDKPRLDYSRWQRDWKAASGDPAAHLDLQKCKWAPVNYITAYMTQAKGDCWGGLSAVEARRHKDWLKGKRHLRRKRGSAPPEPPTAGYAQCCQTDDPSDDPLCAVDECLARLKDARR